MTFTGTEFFFFFAVLGRFPRLFIFYFFLFCFFPGVLGFYFFL